MTQLQLDIMQLPARAKLGERCIARLIHSKISPMFLPYSTQNNWQVRCSRLAIPKKRMFAKRLRRADFMLPTSQIVMTSVLSHRAITQDGSAIVWVVKSAQSLMKMAIK